MFQGTDPVFNTCHFNTLTLTHCLTSHFPQTFLTNPSNRRIYLFIIPTVVIEAYFDSINQPYETTTFYMHAVCSILQYSSYLSNLALKQLWQHDLSLLLSLIQYLFKNAKLMKLLDRCMICQW